MTFDTTDLSCLGAFALIVFAIGFLANTAIFWPWLYACGAKYGRSEVRNHIASRIKAERRSA